MKVQVKQVRNLIATGLLVAGSTAALVTPQIASAAGSLSIYHWFEYIPQELLDKFAKENGDYMVEIMRNEGMLDSFESSELPNFGNIEDQWVDVAFDPGRKHSIPYQWGSTSFMVNRDEYTDEIRTTDILFSPPDELKGRINVLDSQGELLALASLHLGIPQCSQDREQLKALDALLQEAKPHWASFNSDGAKDVLVSGDAAVGMIWNGFGAKAREEGANVEYSYPKEGYVVWMDNVVLLPEANPPADAPAGTFVAVCDEGTQRLYDQIWTNLKK